MAAPSNSGDDEIISAINVTPLVDITLVLLIIFMVTAKIIVSQSLPMDLPKAAQGQEVQQIFGVDLTWGQYILISILGTLGAVGAAGIPGAGLIMMALVFGAVGVPLETIALVAGIDRIMDMMRTTTNVTGDAAVATTVAVMTGEIDTAEMISADDV